MSKTIVAWHYQANINSNQIEKYDLFAETIGATFDLNHGPDGIGETVEINIFFDADSINKDILEKELEKINGQLILLQPVYDHDWQEECVNSFPPIQVGDFYIHSFDEVAPAGKISLKIPARMAFGTGEHSTTKGCLYLYNQLKQQQIAFKNGLDMGCGSAILAIAANKYEQMDFLGVDIDLLSVDIANDNLAINDISNNVQIIYGDGFNDPAVTQKGPYDLIFANILKNPLLDMANDLYDCLENQGYAIISGFKADNQKQEIIDKYVNQLGFTLVDEFIENDWCALALKK